MPNKKLTKRTDNPLPHYRKHGSVPHEMSSVNNAQPMIYDLY